MTSGNSTVPAGARAGRGAAPRRSETAGARPCRDPGCAASRGAATEWKRTLPNPARLISASIRSLRIEPLGIELIGDDAALGMDHHLAADQAVAVPGETRARGRRNGSGRPTPRSARSKWSPHPLAVHQIHDERAARGQGALDRFEHRQIVLGPVEIAERIAEHADAMKLAVAEPETAGVAFMERHLQIALSGALLGEPDQIARPVEPGNVLKAAARELERMAALAAAQIEDAVAAIDARRCGSADRLPAGCSGRFRRCRHRFRDRAS